MVINKWKFLPPIFRVVCASGILRIIVLPATAFKPRDYFLPIPIFPIGLWLAPPPGHPEHRLPFPRHPSAMGVAGRPEMGPAARSERDIRTGRSTFRSISGNPVQAGWVGGEKKRLSEAVLRRATGRGINTHPVPAAPPGPSFFRVFPPAPLPSSTSVRRHLPHFPGRCGLLLWGR